MLNFTKQPQKLASFCCLFVNRNQKLLNAMKPRALFTNHSSQVKFYGCTQSRGFFLNVARHAVIASRKKSGARKASKRPVKEEESDDEDDEDDDNDVEDEDEYIEDGALVKTYKINSLRADLILKQTLKQKRKKIEESFYNNKIRINGKVLLKKAENAKIGDEIDLIKGISKNDPELLQVSRVEILDIKADSDNQEIYLRAKTFKSLEIENYPGADSFEEPEAEV